MYGEYVTARAPVSVWNDIFGALFYNFQNPLNGKVIIRTKVYTIPAVLISHIATVFYTIHPFPPTKQSNVAKRSLTQVSPDSAPALTVFGSVTPSTINTVYGIGANVGSPKSTQAVYEAIAQDYSPTDLASFQAQFGLPPNPITTDIGGYNTDTNAGGEASLDVQYLLAVSPISPSTYWYDASGGRYSTVITTDQNNNI